MMSLAELHNYEHLTTNKGECFLPVNNAHQSIATLSTPSNMQYLSQASTIESGHGVRLNRITKNEIEHKKKMVLLNDV